MQASEVEVCCNLLQCGAMWCIVLHCGAVWCTVVQCELLIVEARETYMYEQKRPICMNKRDLYVWTKETYIHEQYA